MYFIKTDRKPDGTVVYTGMAIGIILIVLVLLFLSMLFVAADLFYTTFVHLVTTVRSGN